MQNISRCGLLEGRSSPREHRIGSETRALDLDERTTHEAHGSSSARWRTSPRAAPTSPCTPTSCASPAGWSDLRAVHRG